jgi:PAS domain S-box-containing protein
MLLQNEHDLVIVLGVAAALLLALAIAAGVLASLKSFQVRQFQDLLQKAERKIDNLERRMFNVLNAVPVALVETDTTGKFTFANKAAHQLLGRKDSELIGLRFHSATWGISYPDGRVVPPDMMPIARTLRGQTVKGFQHLIVNHGSHEKILVSVTSMPIMNGNGEVIGSTSAMVELESTDGEGVDDLTGQWRGHWFSSATVPFWGLDSKGQILDINSAALDAFDLKREDVIGQNWAQLFVEDADYQAALDYLGDSQDDSVPHSSSQVHLKLKVNDSDTLPALVSAWAVKTHEGGDHGLTLMALKDDTGGVARAPEPAVEAAPAAAPLDDDDLQELEDLRNAEQAMARLGIGIWQYDPESDSIVEDEGMRKLIGREVPGGDTLISEEGQAVANTEFAKLLGGKSDELNADIRVVHKDGEVRWITLKGQAYMGQNNERQIFGVAFDSTAFKTAQGIAEPGTVVIDGAQITQADLENARREAAEAAREEVLQAHAAEIEALKAQQAQSVGWTDAAVPVDSAEAEALQARIDELSGQVEALKAQLQEMPEPTTAIEADPAVAAENAELKSRLEDLQAELDQAKNAPAPVADTADLDARIAQLEAQLKESDEARNELQVQLSDILLAPRLVETKDERDVKIEHLNAELEKAAAERDAQIAALKADLDKAAAEHEALTAELNQSAAIREGLQIQLRAVVNAPPPKPDTREWEAKIAAEQFETKKWQAAYEDAQAKLAAMPNIDLDAINAQLAELQTNLSQTAAQRGELEQTLTGARAQQSELQARLEQASAALANARRYETVGRLTGDVAQDFAQMLTVINGALEVMARQADNEQIKRLSEAALAAGKRGERLTRQLQAFQSED